MKAECCADFPPWGVQHLHIGDCMISVVDLSKIPGLETVYKESPFEVAQYGPRENNYYDENRFKTKEEALAWANHLFQKLLEQSPSALADSSPVDR